MRQPLPAPRVLKGVTSAPLDRRPSRVVSVDRGVSVAEAPVDVVGLYAAHRLGLVRLAYLLVDDLTLAEDLVQDAFLGLYRRRGALLDPVAALGYLRISVVNGSRSALRRRRTVRTYADRLRPVPEDAEPADRRLMRAAVNDEVLSALRMLPPRQREVLVLRYWSDLSERQIATTLGISEGSVKSAASRGLDRLERLLVRLDDVDEDRRGTPDDHPFPGANR
jgi:RNA polymerase sigma-70 factor (sigma-E family)